MSGFFDTGAGHPVTSMLPSGRADDPAGASEPLRRVPLLVIASEAPLDARALTGGELVQVSALPGERRGAGWLTGRRALKFALTGAGRAADTSDYRFPNPVASLSHSQELAVAAVLAVDAGGVAGVGVDLEFDRVPDPRTASFFLTEAERAWLDTVPEADRAATLTRLWTVKEALFKADPGNAETVLRDYAVIDPACWSGGAQRGGGPDPGFRYASLALGRGFLSVALALSDSWKVDEVPTVDFDQMASRISSLISVPIERLSPDATVAELVPDSFMFIEVAVDLQEEFDIILTQHDLKDVHTLGDLAALLEARQSEQAVH
jgi:acyl carrier protein